MSSFVPRAVASTLAEPDPTKHVKYTLGMVLGVDDFTQEFAYLSGRDQWLARDLVGYGTVSGLEVNIEVEGSTPQVLVTPGVALSPRGQLIRVAPAQCADLDAWVASHRDELARRLGEVKTNAAGTSLFVTVCYRACSTDMVPIPGEPCRSADETMAASRVTDDFRLELRFDAPTQREEDALRDYADWLGQIEVTNESGASPKPNDFADIIRKAVRPADSKDAGGFMTGPPPAGLKIEAKNAAKYLRTALNLWVTELRPRVQSWRPDIGRGLDAQPANRGEECVLLAEVRLPLTRASATAVWRVGDAKTIEVIEERRPIVGHVRMLQELLLNAGRPPKPQPPAYQVLAAGVLKGVEGSGGNEFNNLRVTKTGAGFVSMTFDGYEQPNPDTSPFQYIVKALLVLPTGSALTQPSVTFSKFEAADTGFTLAVTNAGKAVEKAALTNLSFMVEVSRYATSGKDNKESKEKDTKETKDTKESKDTKDTKEKDTKESKEKEKDAKELEKAKDTKEPEKAKDTKEAEKAKDTKEAEKAKDTKEAEKAKDTKEAEKAKDTKEAEKAKDTKEKEKGKDTKEAEKAKDTKEAEKNAKEVEKAKDTKEAEKAKDTKEAEKAKDTKEAEKAKDTKEAEKAKDTKEKEKGKDTKETKEKDTKETKEKDTKETREKVKDADKLKDAAALKELERSEMKQPDGPAFHAATDDAGATPASGRAFIREGERPEVGRKALELADDSSDDDKPKDVGKPVDVAKPGEASGKQAEARN